MPVSRAASGRARLESRRLLDDYRADEKRGDAEAKPERRRERGRLHISADPASKYMSRNETFCIEIRKAVLFKPQLNREYG